jgi:purine-nucleoside/S-methyl-5'-thioadenosine phosphorylase / adenosine deaminase
VFSWRQQTGRVSWAFTDRAGGRSVGDFGTLNLGGHVGDNPGAVESNRAAVAEAVEVDRDHLLFMQQCHGSDVTVVDGPWSAAGPPPADGVVTATPGVALAVLVADCTPVLLADVERGVVGAVHAGRPGMIAGIVDVAVGRMRELGARDLTAVVGPSICARCYEVPEELRAAAAAVAPESSARSWTGTPAIDVAAGVVAQLAANDVAVHWVPGCSREDDRLFSYRRDGRTGRYAGVVVAGGA